MRARAEKLIDLDGAVALRERFQREGKKLVFTNGCFDLLHLGHVEYLECARAMGDGLLLALNSDRSVRELKGPTRPVVPEDQRAAVVASLECVDGVVVFDSLRVDGVIRAVRPHVYTKGGDYTVEALATDEREAVLASGGTIEIIPFVEGCSSSSLIERIGQSALAEQARVRRAPVRTVFLDRDGVLNRERGHVTSPEELEVVPGAGKAIAELSEAGIDCIVITNQSGLARGLIDAEMLARIHRKLERELAAEGGYLKAIYVSPWHEDRSMEGGNMKYLRDSPERKPAPGLIFRAVRDHMLDLAACVFVGDSARDYRAAEAAGLRFYAVRSPKAGELEQGIEIHDSLAEVAGKILASQRNGIC